MPSSAVLAQEQFPFCSHSATANLRNAATPFFYSTMECIQIDTLRVTQLYFWVKYNQNVAFNAIVVNVSISLLTNLITKY